jgi:hypothetical protein
LIDERHLDNKIKTKTNTKQSGFIGNMGYILANKR